MRPEIHLLGISIKTFGLCFAIAFLASGMTVSRRLVEIGKSAEWAYEMVFAAVVGGLVGSRGYYLIQHYNDVKHDLALTRRRGRNPASRPCRARVRPS